MSLWKRIQRIGMKAAKFQFTVSLEELTLNVDKDFTPKGIVIVFTRRGRRCTSQPVDLKKSPNEGNALTYTWTLPDNLEVITTLYRNEKDISYEDKEWTFQIEDVGMSAEAFRDAGGGSGQATTRRRVLATRALNLAEFAAALPTQNSLKVGLRAVSKRVTGATLFFALHGLLLRSGEATDEDMISVASSMSLTYAPPSAYGARWAGSESPLLPSSSSFNHPSSASAINADFANITSQLHALERCPNDLDEVAEEEENEETTTPKKPPLPPTVYGTSPCGLNSATLNSTSSRQTSNQAENQPVTSQTGQDLLTWCQTVTADYPGVKIKDLTICFRSGLALCAIIHHFQPEAIGDFDAIRALTPTERVRLAFDVASRLGVRRVFVDPCEVTRGRGGAPDRLSMMTYLHQLRTTLVSAASAENEKPAVEESAALEESKAVRSEKPDTETPFTDMGEVKDAARRNRAKAKKKQKTNSSSGSATERYEQLISKARNLLMESKTTPDKTDASNIPSETPETTNGDGEPGKIGVATGNMKARKLKLSNLKLFSDGMETHLSSEANGTGPRSPSLPAHLAKEAAAVAAEQEALDREAPLLERRLRVVMETGGSGAEEEEMLMRRWFQLVSRRDALVHRAHQLSIMEMEADLERTTVLLKAELRELMEKDESQKTAEERRREQQLLDQVVEVVNERNEIVQELDYQEQALVNEVELGLQTDAITQRTYASGGGGGEGGLLDRTRACTIQ